MYLNQVEAFVNVVKYKSFSKAAKMLYLSQPTISAHIKSLESELGVQLIVRTTKDVVLSDAGKIFYEYALELIHIRDVAHMKMQNYSKEVKGRLNIAASTVPAQYILPEVLSTVLKTHPDIFFTIRQMDSQAVINSVENFEVELGVTGTLQADSKCIFEPFIKDRLTLITPNTERFRRMEGNFPTNMIAKEQFVWREEGSGTRKEASAFLESLNISADDLRIVTEMQSTESVKQAVHSGLGISIVSRTAVEDYVKFGYLLAFDFDTDLLDRNLYLVYHKNRMFSPATDYFFNYLKDHYSQIPTP